MNFNPFKFRRCCCRDTLLLGRSLFLSLATVVVSTLSGQPVISEFMASNGDTIQDEDGDYSDWIEIHNPGSSSLNLQGWYLTDDAETKTKWQFPAVTVPAGGYLIVFASDEDRTDPAAPLHTNFKLSAGGEYLGLIAPDGLIAATEFSAEYPSQTADISYGITQPVDPDEDPILGFFLSPTPGTRNGDSGALLILDEVIFSPTSGPFSEDTFLHLSGVAGDQKIHFVLNPPSATGASFDDPTSNDPLYPGPILLTDTAVIRAAIFSADGERRGPVSNYHYVRADNSTADRIDTFTSKLPLLVFDNHGVGPMAKEDPARTAWLYTFGNESGGMASITESPDVARKLELEVRGQTSSRYVKKPYKFDLIDQLGLKVEEDLAGGGQFNEWAIIAPGELDQSYIRNSFVYGLSNTMGRWAPDTRLVEAFFNWDGDALELSDYIGIYVITDQLEVESGRVELESLDADDNDGESITGGYSIEIDGPDPGKYQWETAAEYPTTYDSVLQLDSPKMESLTIPQRDYITDYVQRMETALFTGRTEGWKNRSYLQYLDRSSWIDFHLLNVMVQNVDAFWRGAKFTKDRNQRIVAGPVWDYDRSLGSADDRDNFPTNWSPTNDESFDWVIDVWNFEWWGLIARDPEFMQGWFDRWQELRGGPFASGALDGRIDALANEIGETAAARDVARWPGNASEHGSFAAEIAHVKDWLRQRVGWIDGMLVAAPEVTQNPDGSTTVTPAPSSELIYTLNGANPRLRGGAVAPDAVRTEGPVTFPAGSKFRARSYNQLLEVWPGTKWSRSIPGDLGAPYHPSPRLANLSSRALVEGGDNVLISGLIINDSDNKRVLLRGVGPALAEFGVNDALTDPVLTVFDSNGDVVAENSGWSAENSAEQIAEVAERVGAFPLDEGSLDSALLLDLPVGRYTVHLGSASGASGTGLTEIYEQDDIGALINLSVRGSVTGSTAPLIAGFVVSGNEPKRVLVRGVGPGLENFGVSTFLPDPVVRVESAGDIIATNDDWTTGDADLVRAVNPLVGAFDLEDGSKDAVVVVTLPPGVYTAVISGAGNEAGLALVEVYEIE